MMNKGGLSPRFLANLTLMHKVAHSTAVANRPIAGGILEALPGAVVQVAMDGALLHANAEAQRLLGRTSTELQRLRVRDFADDTIREDGTPCPVEEYPVSRCLATGMPQNPSTIGLRRPDGQVMWLLTSAVPVCDAHSDQPAGAVVSFLDISERKRIEEQLRESEERYRTLFQFAPTGLGVAALDGTLLFYNRAMLEPGGYSDEDIARLGNVANLYANPDDRGKVLALARAQGRVRRYPVKFKRKNGTTYDTLLSLTPTVIGGQTCWQAMCEDVTDRNRTEAELRRRTGELQAVVEAFPDLHFRAAADGTIVDYHAGSEADLFLDPEDFLGQRVQDVLPSPVGHRLHQAIMHTLDQMAMVRTEYSLDLDSDRQHYEARLLPMPERQVFAIVRNVTEQKLAEEALRRSRDELEARVDERTAMLRAANQALRKQIADREQAETSLAASEARLRTIVETAPDFIITVDRQGIIRFINQARPPLTVDQLVGSPAFEWLSPDHRQEVHDKLATVFRTGQPVAIETRTQKPGEDPAWFDCRMGPVRHGADVVAATIIASDITPRKRAEAERERLLDAEQRARVEAELTRDQITALIESSSDAVWSVDRQRRLVTFNSLFSSRFQKVFAREPKAGLGPDDLLPTDLAAYWNQIFDRALAGERFSVEQQFTIDGELQHFDVSVNPILGEGGVSGVVVFSRDVTEYRRLIVAKEQQATILSATLDSIGDGVVVANGEGRFEFFNRAAANILGLGAVDAPLAEWSQVYGLFNSDGRTRYPSEELPLARALRGVSSDDVEMILRREGATEDAWLNISARPVVDREQQRTYGAVAAFRDITERKLAREAMDAEQEFKERLLEAHEQERALLAYEVHDGLCQDIAAAKMHLEGLVANMPGLPAEQQQAFHQVLCLLGDSIDEGRRVMNGLRPPIIDEFGVIPAIEYLVAGRKGQTGPPIKFTHDVQFDRLPPLLEGTIFRIAQEALNNVRRHSGARTARIDLTQRGDRVLLEVSDDGCGFQAEQVDKRRFGLRGIRERARVLRGRASIDSTPGQGTRVRVELPLSRAHPISTKASLP